MSAAGIVNRAIQEIAGQATVIGTVGAFTGPDGTQSTYSEAANILYTAAVNFMLRSQDWEFAFTQLPLVASGGAPAYPWTAEYLYPDDCQRLRQVYPATWTPTDPQPVRWTFSNAIVATVERRVILCTVAGALAAYTTSAVTEDMWDPIFAEGVVRLLASEFAMAVAGRPDYAAKMLEWSGSIAGDGAGRDS